MALDASQADSGFESADAGSGAVSASGGGYGAYGSGYDLGPYPDLTSNRLLYPQAAADGSNSQSDDGSQAWSSADPLPASVRAYLLPPGTPMDPSGAAAQASIVSPGRGNQDIAIGTFPPLPRPLLTAGAQYQPQIDDFDQYSYRVASPQGATNYAPDTFLPGARALAQLHPGDTYAGVRVEAADISDAQQYVDWAQRIAPNPHAGMDWNGYDFVPRASGLDPEQQAFQDENHRLQRKYWYLPAVAAAPFAVPAAPLIGAAGAWIGSQAPWTVPLSVGLSGAAVGAPSVAPEIEDALPEAQGLVEGASDASSGQAELSSVPDALHPVQVNRMKGMAHQESSAEHWDSELDDFADEVLLRPNTANGPANYRVRVDGVGRDRVTGQLRLKDAKLGQVPSYTPNQRLGYPLVKQYGGTFEGAKGGLKYPRGMSVPPTEVEITRPEDLPPRK